MDDLRRRLYQARRLIARHRRPISAVLAAVTVLTLVRALSAPPPPSSRVVVATHDLAAGSTISSDDVRRVELPSEAVPASAVASAPEAVGRILAGPMADGELVTSVRLVGAALVRGLGPEQVAAPVRMADTEAVRLLRVGDRIDVFAARAAGESASIVVADALVAAVPEPSSNVTGTEGALLVLSVLPTDAARLAQEAARAPLTFAVRAPR